MLAVLFYFEYHFFLLDLCLRTQSLGESSQVSGEQHAMRPSSLLAPQLPEMVADGIIGSLGQTLMSALAELIIPLRDLPDCIRSGQPFESVTQILLDFLP